MKPIRKILPKKNEEWKEIPGFNGMYEVSTLGRVRSWYRHIGRPGRRKEPRVLKQAFDTSGYPMVCLSDGDNKRNHTVHRLVAEAFMPNPENMPYVCHKNGIPTKNDVENLYWGTPQENQNDRIRHGNSCKGSKSGMSKITEEDVREIRRLHPKVSRIELAKRYKMTPQNMSYILLRKTWKHV